MKVHRMRTCAATVSFVYFFTNAAMAHTPETNLWAERRRHSEINRTNNKNNVHLASLPSIPTVPKIGQSLSPTNANNILSEEVTKTLPKGFVAQHADLFSALPTTHGTIRKIWLPADGPGKRVVIYIQDVHQNEEAQQHIAGAVESLLQARQAGLLALEGAFDVIDVRAYHDFEDREVIGLTADCLLRENFITGPVHAAMTTTANLPPLLGVDDPVHYNANVNAYRQSAPKIGVFKKDLAARKFNLEKTKSSVFSTALSSFDAKVTAYKEDRLPLSEYVIALAPESGVGQAGLFLQALSIEKKLDFQKVEADRKKLIETLVNHLSKQQIDQLVQESAGYRMGQVRYGEFYRDLQSLCRSAKIDLAKYPHMDNYIRYVLLSDRIDTEKLIDELATLQTTRYQTLAKTPREKELVVQSTTLQLTARLLDFALTPAEWADYEQLNSKPTGFPDLTSFEAFYKEAHARDTAITENLLKTMDAHQANTALLVTGGYHSPGVAHRLRQAGVTVISFTPRIEKVDTLQGSAYLSVFTQEKTPLEKLFAGEKLYVSPDPGVQATQTTGAILAVGVAAVKNGIPAANKTLNWFLGGITKVTIAMKDGTAYLKVKREGLKNGVQFRVVSSPKGFQFTQTALTAFFGLALAYALFPKMQWVFTTMTSLFTNTISMDPFWNIMIAVTLLVLSNSNRPFFPSFLRSSDVSKQHQSNNKLQNELGEISLMSEDGSIAQNKLFTTNGAEGQKSKELGDIEKRYLRLLTLVRELGWVVFKKRLVSILKLTPSISVDDFQKHMRETLTMGLYDLTVRTKKLSPLEAFQTLVRFSRWLDFPDAEYKALNEMAQRAINKKTPPDVKEEIRSFLENRAQTHLNKNTGDKIKRWVRIHKLMDQWSRKEVRPVGKTGYTDWHVLVFLQLFLADYLDSQESMTTLNFDLNSLDPKIISMLNIGQIRNKIESRASEGAVRAMSSDWGVARSVTNKREKMPFIKKLSQEKITKLLSDEAFFDRFLYFLYIAHQELIDLEESSSPTPVSPVDVKTMLKKLQRKITEIPTKSNEAVNLKFPQASWLSSKIIGHALYFGLAWGVAAWFGVEGTSFLINHWFAITVFGIITWPLSVSFTGFNSVASLWEAWMLIKSPERWALNHLRIKKETPEYKTLLEVGNSLRSTYEKTGFFRMILAHNKYNFEQSQKSLREGPLFFFISPYSFAHIIGHAIVGLLMGLTWEKGTNIFSKNPTFIFSSSPSRWGEGFIAMGGIVAEIILGSLSIFLLWSGTWGEFTIPAKIIGIVGHLSGVGYIYTGLINKKQMEPANKGNRFFARTAEEAQNEITNRKRAFSDYRSDLHKIFIALFQPDGRTDRIFMTPLAQDSNSPGTPLHGDEKQKSDSKAQTFDSSEVRAITINMAAVREPHSLDEFDGRAYRWALLSPTLQQENEASLAKRLAPIINLKHLTLKGVFASLAILFARGEPAPSAARVAIPENLLNNQKSLAKIVTGTNLVHRGNLDVVFLVDNKENAIRFKRLHPKLKVVVAVGLFSGESQLNLAAFEPHLPLPGREVTLYKPHSVRVNANGVHDKRLNENNLVDLETLAELMNRFWRIANLIANQA